MNPFEFEGQTAPESTRGLFDFPEQIKKKEQRRRSVELASRTSTYRASLQPVNEERAMSRADVLAETEAKLTRRLSEPNQTARRSSTSRPGSLLRLSTGSISSDPNRKPLFISHLPFSSVLPHLKSHVLVSGILRVNRRNRSNAYVFSDELNSDIYICGSRDRNRALEGDRVAVKLIEVERIMMEKHEKEEAKLARNNGQPLIRKPDEEDEKEIMFGGEEDVDLVPPKYCGTVVAILDRAQNQVFSGTLGLTRPSHKKPEDQQHPHPPRIIWFKSTDKRVPLIAIPVEQAPPGFIENPDDFEHRLFLASIRRWPITSLHPFGVLEKELGDVHNVEIQLDAIFADHTICTHPLAVDVIQEKHQDRLDLRHLPCFTLGTDRQNALTIEHLTDTIKVGLHVSDITAFVELDSKMDKDARSRGMSVDGVLKQIPLWPDPLHQTIELVQGQDRPAFSVIWTMTEDGRIEEIWFGKTLIHSIMLLTEDTVQEILSVDSIDEESTEADIVALYSIACLFHAKRHLLKAPQLKFQFDGTTPIRLDVAYHRKPIFEEFQLLANTHVAQRIASHFPEQALLVSQPAHRDRKMRSLLAYLDSFGYPLDPTSLASSIDAIQQEEAQKVIRALVLKCFSAERYYCSGACDISRYYHHGLDLPLYTHFASPLTRYSDVIVHHQLYQTLLDDSSLFPVEVDKMAEHCNLRRRSADQVLENAQHLFLSCYLALQRHVCDAIVVGVQEGVIDVMVLPFQLERRIHTLHLPLTSDHLQDAALHLIWQKTETTPVNCRRKSICGEGQEPAIFPEERRQVIRPFDVIQVSVEAHPVRNPPLIRVLPLNPFEKHE
ncbi:hypothetical protein G6F43_006479 [Rhizopus delemar]|nr:hypothetical protein G6F43_006479 [Rhizopus delemar]